MATGGNQGHACRVRILLAVSNQVAPRSSCQIAVCGVPGDPFGVDYGGDHGQGHDVGGNSAYIAESLPVDLPATRTERETVSPSNGMCTGRIARASPSWAICATFVAWDCVQVALVATTPMVVF